MTTLILVTGWECGLASIVNNGGGLAASLAGSPSIQSTVKRTGGYALQINPSASVEYINLGLPSGKTILVGSVYVRFAEWNNVDNEVVTAMLSAGAGLCVAISATNHKLHARWYGIADGNEADLALSLDTWYRIDFKFDTSANPNKIDFQVVADGGSSPVSAAQSTRAQAASTFTTQGLGGGQTDTLESYYDDLVVSDAEGDYPIGAHAVIGLRPNADGSHNNAANIMEDSAGNDINGSSIFAFDKLDEDPWVSTANADYVRQTGNGTGNYCEILFADTSQTVILGASALLEYASATATGNNGGCIIIDEDATNTTLWGAPGALADYSENSAYYKSVILPTPTGGWDQGAVNALKCRFGYSGDASPDPYWLAIMIEMAYGEGTTISLSSGAITAAGQALGVTPGAVSTGLNASSIGASGPLLSVTPGAVSLALAAAALAAGGQSLTVTPGAVSLAMLAAALAAAGQAITIQSGGEAQQVDLSTGALSAGGQSLTAQPGAVSVALAAPVLMVSGQTITVQAGAISVSISNAILAANGQTITISAEGVIQISLSAGALGAGGQSLMVQTGAVSVAMAAPTLTAMGLLLAVQPGEASLALLAGGLSAEGQPFTIQPGGINVALMAALLIASGPGIVIRGLTSIPISQLILIIAQEIRSWEAGNRDTISVEDETRNWEA